MFDLPHLHKNAKEGVCKHAALVEPNAAAASKLLRGDAIAAALKHGAVGNQAARTDYSSTGIRGGGGGSEQGG